MYSFNKPDSRLQSCIAKTVQYTDLKWWNLGFSWHPHIIYCVGVLQWQYQAECSWMNKHRRRLSSAQIYMKRWYPTCWEACRKLSHNNLSPNSKLYRYIQGWFTHSQTDKQAHIIKKKKEDKSKMNRSYVWCWCNDPCFILSNSLWWTDMESTGERWQRLCLWVKYSFHKSLLQKTETW